MHSFSRLLRRRDGEEFEIEAQRGACGSVRPAGRLRAPEASTRTRTPFFYFFTSSGHCIEIRRYAPGEKRDEGRDRLEIKISGDALLGNDSCIDGTRLFKRRSINIGRTSGFNLSSHVGDGRILFTFNCQSFLFSLSLVFSFFTFILI